MLRWSGLPVVYLRPAVFFDGMFLVQSAKDIGDDNAIRPPFAVRRRQASPIAAADVGTAAVAVLVNREPHIGKVYEPAGPQSLTMAELREFRGATGCTIPYVNVPAQIWEAKLRELQQPAAYAQSSALGGRRVRRGSAILTPHHSFAGSRPPHFGGLMNIRTSIVATCVAILVSGSSYAADPPIAANQARDRIGKRATVCGEVVSVVRVQTPRAGGEQLFMHFDEPPPNSPFIVGIIGTELLNVAFRGVDKAVDHKTVCATGNIKLRGTTPLMVITGPNQLKITDPARP